MQLMWIQFAFDAHLVYANSIHIQTESSEKGPLYITHEGWEFYKQIVKHLQIQGKMYIQICCA